MNWSWATQVANQRGCLHLDHVSSDRFSKLVSCNSVVEQTKGLILGMKVTKPEFYENHELCECEYCSELLVFNCLE